MRLSTSILLIHLRMKKTLNIIAWLSFFQKQKDVFERGRVVALVLLLFISSCKKEESPENPYDGVNYNTGGNNDSIPDPASITGLHKNIFFPRCANPGCHDGTFEPDFRTVQSSYSTLLYMGVTKKTLDSINFFNYRVIPNEEANSFLIERLTTSTSDYMPSNGVRLSSTDIGNVRKWIQNGCPDVDGNLPVKPNLPPNIIGFIATDTLYNRLDTARQNGVEYLPFFAPANQNMYVVLVALDTADGTTATDPANFTEHKIKWSLDPNNFAGAPSINAFWMSPIPFPYWQVIVNTGQWSVGTTVYFRVYMNDGFQSSPAELPKNQSADFYKTYFAFIIQ